MKLKTALLCAALLLSLLLCSACGSANAPQQAPAATAVPTQSPAPTAELLPTPAPTPEPTPEPPAGSPVHTVTEVNVRSAPSAASDILATLPAGMQLLRTADDGEWSTVLYNDTVCYMASAYLREGYLIVIDAGHQLHADYSTEPVGPGSDAVKARVSSGTEGVSTRLPEYELNLAVALLLQEELEARGYEVLMVRTDNAVNLSNAERAAIANDAYADAFIRIHANGSEDRSVSGAMTICQTPQNPWNGNLYGQSKRLSLFVLQKLCAEAGCKQNAVWETDTMSGINWCQVPVTIVEMGYMSNPEEDVLLSDPDYQVKIARGIANGVDDFFSPCDIP